MKKKYAITVETFVGAGHFQHEVSEIGNNPYKPAGDVNNEIVDALKNVNESVWKKMMPEGSSGLKITVKYKG